MTFTTYFDRFVDVVRNNKVVVAAAVVVAVLLVVVVARRPRREGLAMPTAGSAVGTIVTASNRTGYTVSYTFNGKPMTYVLDPPSYGGMMMIAGSNGMFIPTSTAALGIKMNLTLTSTGTVVPGGQKLGAFGTIPTGATLTPTSVVVGTVQNPIPAKYPQFYGPTRGPTYVVSYTFGGQTKYHPLYVDSPSAYAMYGLDGTSKDVGKQLHLTLTAFGDVINISI